MSSSKFTKKQQQVIEKLNNLYDEYASINKQLEEIELRMLEREKRMLELQIEKRELEMRINEREKRKGKSISPDDSLYSP
jgi:uncharacterized protein YukE